MRFAEFVVLLFILLVLAALILPALGHNSLPTLLSVLNAIVELAVSATIVVLTGRLLFEKLTNKATPDNERPRPVAHHTNDVRRPVFTIGTNLAIISVMLGECFLVVQSVSVPISGVRLARVRSEIESFKASITQFKVRFGTNPPSGMMLYESIDGWKSDARSRAFVRRLWPQFDFTRNRDINNDGDTEDAIRLSGAECLVFFLGGVHPTVSNAGHQASDQFCLTGFSKNPLAPFSGGGSRDGPFFEFHENRLTDVDGDGCFEYRAPLVSTKAPYLYFSSYDGAGYRKDDCAIYLPGDARNPTDLYYKDKDSTVPYNSDSFQIICAGVDDRFGAGGHFAPETADEVFVGERKFERDNITNFSISINENADPDVPLDLELAFNEIAREDFDYRHTLEGPDDMPAHVKSSMIGSSVTIPISNGRLCLGTWQGIYLCEHRNRAGSRRLVVTIQGDEG